MKRQLRALVERVGRRMPLLRAAYHERDALRARVRALEAPPPALPPELGDPHHLERLVPPMRATEQRIQLATHCRDADALPKVPLAGAVVMQDDGSAVQIMHNGLRVVAGGYYGPWMQELISRCRGHHEPQEEVVFAEVLRHLEARATMIELGGYWSFYSLWFLSGAQGRRSYIVEADPAHLAVGQANARLNGCVPVFVHAFAGPQPLPPGPFQTESSGVLELPCVSVAALMQTHGIARLDLLHCDIQGAEFPVLESCVPLAMTGRLGWIVVSTHSHHISHDPLTHQRCLAVLRRAGATVLAEHDVQESFSGDGLIVAKFGEVPIGWRSPRLSFNRASESLFRNPLYDLASLGPL